jgi:hypothetical protein
MEQVQHPATSRVSSLTVLPEVWEPEEPELRQVFSEIPAATGSPGVHQLWRRLASQPAFLTAIWPAASAALNSPALDAEAARLRSAAFIVEAVGMPSHKAFRGDLVRAEIDADFRAKIEHFNDFSQFTISRLLVLVSALIDAGAGRLSPPADIVIVMPRIPGAEAVYVPPFREDEASGKSGGILERVAREHGLPFLDDYYRSLARVPEFLSAAWNAIRPIVGDPVYIARAARLSRMAGRAGATLPAGSIATSALSTMPAPHAAAVRMALEAFAKQVLPQTLIDVTLIKALTSGPGRATTLDP